MSDWWIGYLAGIATIVLPSLLYLLAAYLWPDPGYDKAMADEEEKR